MATFSHLVTKYNIILNAGASISTHYVTVRVNCFNSAGTNLGQLTFYKEGAQIPFNSVGSANRIYLNFPGHRYQEIITTLREENPIYMGINSTSKLGWISTSQEAVGEEEGS